MAEPFSATFGRPFAEQVAAYRLRLGDLAPTQRWDDIQRSAHDRSFMVAGAMKADLLADLAGAVDKSISEGRGLEEFRKDFRDIVERHGWHGWTGEGTKKGEAWRTRVIYRTNASTSYAAGRMAQLLEGGFRYWVYRHGGSLEPRLQHLGWDGLILPPGHAFWATHAPPNGWGCSCYVLGARSIRAAIRLGGNPAIELPKDWQSIDPRTGTPKGIDKGWDYAPGATASDAILTLREKLDTLPEQPSIDLIQDWIQASFFREWFSRPSGSWPVARIPLEDAGRIGARRTVADLSAASATKQKVVHPELLASDYALIQKTINEATHRIVDGAVNMVYVLDADYPGGHVVVVKATRTGEGLFVTSFRRISRDQAVRDMELRRLLRKK